MIQINLQFETGAEARKALTELLGGHEVSTEKVDKFLNSIKDEKIAENFETPKTEIEKTEKPKRQTKAEKALEAAKPAIEEQLGEMDIQDEEPAKEEPKASTITKEMLQEKAVNLIRNGKKAEVTETIKKFGADSISQADKNPVKPEDYAALMDAFNAIG
jgi:hypothetical protein